MKNILVVMPFEQRHKEMIEAKAPGCRFTYSTIAAVTDEQVCAADVIIGNVAPGQVKKNDHLQWMQLNSAGADPYCKPGIMTPGTLLTCATGAYGLTVSEHMVASSMMLCRKMDLYMRNQTARNWHMEGKVTSVWNSTTLVLGLGDIGGEYAKRMKALGSYVIGIRRNTAVKPDYVDELYTMDELDRLLPRADFVAMVLPSTAATYHIMDARRLSLMKPGAYLLNAGRGDAVDPDALLDALNGGIIGGCALDVTEPEPLPADHPLWDAPRCIITPHSAGKFFLQETFERIVRITGENLEAFLSGNTGAMRNLIDHQKG